MGRYPVFCRGGVCGEMMVCRRGLYDSFSARLDIAVSGIPRLYLIGERDEELLGVMQPENGGYRLEKSLAVRTVERLGVIRCGEVRLKSSEEGEWRALRPEELQFCRAFCAQLPKAQSGLCCVRAEMTQLAFPYEQTCPFPFPALFCLARVVRIRKRDYVVFSFDRTQYPILSEM